MQTNASAQTPKPVSTGASQQYLTFVLGGQSFGLEVSALREIVQQTEWTVVPLMPPFVRGIINLRGSVVPVIDLQVRMGGAASPLSKKSCVVICDTPGLEGTELGGLGLLVDSVSEVVELAPNDLQSAPHFGNSVARELIQGLVKMDGQLMVILATQVVCNLDEMGRLIEQAAQPH